MRLLAPLLALLLLPACATTSYGSQAQAELDPYENFNRGMYGFNKGLDTVVLKPVAVVYRTVTPVAARRGASRVLDNIDEPLTFVNALLQGKPKSALNALARFVINTTIGVGGLADHATGFGLQRQEEDFGQTLAVWGVNSGPYLVLPLFGPSTFRDTVGLGLDAVADPWNFAQNELFPNQTEVLGFTGFEIIDLRSRLMDSADVLLRGSADEYATVRSAYLQARAAQIYDGTPPEPEEIDMDALPVLDAAPADAEKVNAPPQVNAPETPAAGVEAPPQAQ